MSKYSEDLKRLNKLDRDKYIEVYDDLGHNMYENCYIPNVGDFANAYGKKKNGKSKEASERIKQITSFTGNYDDIVKSVTRTSANYTEDESAKFMNSVIAANVTNITQSGFFYKKVMSSTDNMRIDDVDDCGSAGDELTLPKNESEYNYKFRNHFITELDDYTEDYDDFKKKTKGMTSVHVRSFLSCNLDPNHRHFCKKCAGLYRKAKYKSFVPKNIGLYASLMITEHATQASLDSMNKGTSQSLNVLLEQRIEPKNTKTYDDCKKVVNSIIDQIGDVGVQARFYEIALLSRLYRKEDGSFEPAPMVTSFNRQGDKLGSFIYQPTKQHFDQLLAEKEIQAKSIKSKIAFDIYD